jgi:hypothetical protein
LRGAKGREEEDMTDNGYGISEGNDKNAMESVIW